jgi:hypothetical protein
VRDDAANANESARVSKDEDEGRRGRLLFTGTKTCVRHARPWAGHPRLAFVVRERRGWPGQARP